MNDLIERQAVIDAMNSEGYTKNMRVHKKILQIPAALLPAAPRWHRVEDGLPDLLQFVVVCNDEGKCVVAQYVGYQTDGTTPWRIAYSMYDTDAYFEADEGPVCYWMPIEPPKEDA